VPYKTVKLLEFAFSEWPGILELDTDGQFVGTAGRGSDTAGSCFRHCSAIFR